jgi:hypothetical protein
MQASKLNQYLQILASVAVLFGLILVAYEVQQNNKLAEAEAVRELTLSWRDVSTVALETQIPQLQLKSWSAPDELTQEEILELSEWLAMVMYQIMATESMERRGLMFEGSTGSFEEWLVVNFHAFYGDQFGRAWYLTNRYWIPPRLVEVMDRELKTMDGNAGPEYIESIRRNL